MQKFDFQNREIWSKIRYFSTAKFKKPDKTAKIRIKIRRNSSLIAGKTICL